MISIFLPTSSTFFHPIRCLVRHKEVLRRNRNPGNCWENCAPRHLGMGSGPVQCLGSFALFFIPVSINGMYYHAQHASNKNDKVVVVRCCMKNHLITVRLNVDVAFIMYIDSGAAALRCAAVLL